MICPNCKKSIPDNNVFCTFCGTSVYSAARPDTQYTTPAYFETAYTAPTTSAHGYSPSGSGADSAKLIKVVAILVAMVLVCITTVALNRNVEGEWEFVGWKKNGMSRPLSEEEMEGATLKIDGNTMVMTSRNDVDVYTISVRDDMIYRVSDSQYRQFLRVDWSGFATLILIEDGNEWSLSRNYTAGYIVLNGFAVLVLVLLGFALVKLIRKKSGAADTYVTYGAEMASSPYSSAAPSYAPVQENRAAVSEQGSVTIDDSLPVSSFSSNDNSQN